MNIYKDKYLKYKKKYLRLKYGGANRPNDKKHIEYYKDCIDRLKNKTNDTEETKNCETKLFPSRGYVHFKYYKGISHIFNLKNEPYIVTEKLIDSKDMNQVHGLYLDPLWGVYHFNEFVKNYYFFQDKKEPIRKLIHILYKLLPQQPVRVSKFINVSPYEIGMFLTILYNYIIKHKDIEIKMKENLENKVKDIGNDVKRKKTYLTKKLKELNKISPEDTEKKELLNKKKESLNKKILNFDEKKEIEEKKKQLLKKYKQKIEKKKMKQKKEIQKLLKSSSLNYNFKKVSCDLQDCKDEKKRDKKCKNIPENIVNDECNIYTDNLQKYTDKLQKYNKKKKDSPDKNIKEPKKPNSILNYFNIQNKNKFKNIIDIFLNILYSDSDKKLKQLLQFFHVFLGYLLNTAENKQGIKDYLLGIQAQDEKKNIITDKKLKEFNVDDIFNSLNLITEIQRYERKGRDSITTNSFPQSLVLAFLQNKKKGILFLETYKNVEFHDIYFPDCGETTLRNLFKILLYDKTKNIIDYKKLIKLKADPKLILFFKIFSLDKYFIDKKTILEILADKKINKKTIISEFSEEIKIDKLNFDNLTFPFDDNDIPETAWLKVVENLLFCKVKYNKSFFKNEKKIRYEIASGLNEENKIPNILAVIKNLFFHNKEIKKSNDLVNVLKIIISTNNNDEDEVEDDNIIKTSDDIKQTGFGSITIHTNYQSYIFYLDNGHFWITSLLEEKIEINKELNDEIKKYDNIIKKSFFYQNITIDNIISIIEEFYPFLSDNIVIINNIIEFIDQNDNRDLIRRIYKTAMWNGYLEIVKLLVEKNIIEKINKNINDVLVDGINNRHYDITNFLLTKEVNINYEHNEYYKTPLVIAIEKKSENIIKLLISNMANVNYETRLSYTPLTTAINRGFIKIINLLIDNKADINRENKSTLNCKTPLMEASGTGFYIKKKSPLNMVRFLIYKKAEINYRNVRGNTALMKAIQFGTEDVIKHLIEKKADIDYENKNGETPLMKAMMRRSKNLLKYFVEQRGLNINYVNSEGETPLIVASRAGAIDAVKYLIEQKAEILVRNKAGETPLIVASQNYNYGHDLYFDIIKHLINNKANVNDVNNDGDTPLLKAIEWNKENVVKYLIENKADIDYKNKAGETVITKYTKLPIWKRKENLYKYLMEQKRKFV